ncbi:hypothetical protein SBA3_790024 [Candidatus Sulfopaludibacter sp. SbA3]|nr:hypothetical protein SBA3_790024 [Candidatus Sulfopaludibacter sp. SbA3]
MSGRLRLRIARWILLLLPCIGGSLQCAIIRGVVVENQTGKPLSRSQVTAQPIGGTPVEPGDGPADRRHAGAGIAREHEFQRQFRVHHAACRRLHHHSIAQEFRPHTIWAKGFPLGWPAHHSGRGLLYVSQHPAAAAGDHLRSRGG